MLVSSEQIQNVWETFNSFIQSKGIMIFEGHFVHNSQFSKNVFNYQTNLCLEKFLHDALANQVRCMSYEHISLTSDELDQALNKLNSESELADEMKKEIKDELTRLRDKISDVSCISINYYSKDNIEIYSLVISSNAFNYAFNPLYHPDN